jgi:hypothetical protein
MDALDISRKILEMIMHRPDRDYVLDIVKSAMYANNCLNAAANANNALQQSWTQQTPNYLNPAGAYKGAY